MSETSLCDDIINVNLESYLNLLIVAGVREDSTATN